VSESKRGDRETAKFRRWLERAVEQTHGSISPTAATHIWIASRAFRRARRIEAKLRELGETATPEQWLAYVSTSGRHEHDIAKHIRDLRLDASTAKDEFADLYRLNVPFIDQDAPDATPEPLADK